MGEGRVLVPVNGQEKGVLVEVLEWGRMGGLSLESALCGLESV